MKKLKQKITLLLYNLVLFAVKRIPPDTGTKHLLIIKTDEIGDYILFRNLFKAIITSSKYKSYQFTIIGNQAWKSLYDEFDKDLPCNVIWLNKGKFKKNLSYRFQFLRRIRDLKTSEVINCIFSRSMLWDDALAFVAGGRKFAMKSGGANFTVKNMGQN